jgi:hypothetical protein
MTATEDLPLAQRLPLRSPLASGALLSPSTPGGTLFVGDHN